MSRQSYSDFNPGKGNSTMSGPSRGGTSSKTRIASGGGRTAPSGLKPPGRSSSKLPGKTASTSSIIGGNKPGIKPIIKNQRTNTDEEEEFVLPAFSLTVKPRKFAEKDKKKHMRRNKPAGEDLAKLKEILKGVKRQDITVQEYIGLISPSTGDNGELLRNILAEELATFRGLARKIYETNTQDVSDVLTNEHIQLTEGGNERKQLYEERMMRSINEIFMYCSDFQFEKYYTQIGYLDEKFPTVTATGEYGSMEPEDEEALLRQEAYHRYQWLKNEGERLSQENKKLQARLQELKKQQRDELNKSAQKEQEVEIQHEELEAQQEELKEKLEELELSVEKCLVEQEMEKGAEEGNIKLTNKRPPIRGLPKPKIASGRSRESDTWAMQAAADIEQQQQQNVAILESAKLTMKKKQSSGAIKKKRRVPQEQSGHYSPIKTPPPKPRVVKEKSPFHFSPLKSPPRVQEAPRERSPFHYSPEPQQSGAQESYMDEAMGGATTPRRPMHRTTTSTTVIDESSRRTGREAPRDTWGGFY